MKLLRRALPSLTMIAFIGGFFVLFFENEYFQTIAGKGDNIPIAGMIPIVAFFTYLALKEALKHDRLIKEGKRDKVLDEMRK